MTETSALEPATETPDLETMPRANVPAIWDEFKAKAVPLADQAKSLVVTESSLELCDTARAIRLGIRRIRLDVEAKRKELGDAALRSVQAINKAANAVTAYLEPLEEHLLAQEKFAERLAETKKAELLATRTKRVADAGRNPSHYNLAGMSEIDFEQLLITIENEALAKAEADRKAKEEKAACEKAEAEARERQRVEFERMKAENAKREAELKAEREKAEAERQEAARLAKEQAEAARQEREALEAKAAQQRAELEAKAKAEREAAEKQARELAEAARKEREAAEAVACQEREKREALEAAERERLAAEAAAKKAAEAAAAKARRAPDKTKLAAFAGQVAALPLPELESPEGKAITAEIEGMCQRLIEWVNKKAATL